MSKITIKVKSSNLNNTWYTINRFTEYNVNMDLEADSNDFSFIMTNPNGIFSGLVSIFDDIKICANGKGIMRGIVDDVQYTSSGSESTISISGRDLMAYMIDNDVEPKTRKNVKPVDYIGNRAKRYGIKYKNEESISLVDTIDISNGDTEITVIDKLLEKASYGSAKGKQMMWYIYDTLYTGYWSTSGTVKYTFMRGSEKYIPITSIRISESGREIKSDIKIYGTNDDGTEYVMGTSKLESMNKKKIPRLLIQSKDSDDTSSNYTARAKLELKKRYREAIVVEIDTYYNKTIFMPNRLCKIIDKEFGLNDNMFIRSIHYTKGLGDGSKCTLTCIPSNKTLNKLLSSTKLVYSIISTEKNKNKATLTKTLDKYSKKWT